MIAMQHTNLQENTVNASFNSLRPIKLHKAVGFLPLCPMILDTRIKELHSEASHNKMKGDMEDSGEMIEDLEEHQQTYSCWLYLSSSTILTTKFKLTQQ